MVRVKGIALKKRHGQNFLRSQSVVDEMLDRVSLESSSSVFEIGCGDGFLTKSILAQSLERLWVFEIDPEWAGYVEKMLKDERLTIFTENILDIDWQKTFATYAPWTILSNLPYHISFPILHLLVEHRSLIKEGVIMVQEEVAQKILKTSGRGYGFPSIFFQHFFQWELMKKIPPSAFIPPPKVFSRLLYFKPQEFITTIPDEQEFWKFVKICFRSPRRTLRNNLMQAHFDLSRVPEEKLKKRAQQMNKDEILELWDLVR